MSRATLLTWRLLILSLLCTIGIATYATGFDPVINMLGFTSAVKNGETVEWVVTFSNTGDNAGQNIVLSNTVGDGLQVESVQFNSGTNSINGRTVTVSLPMLDADETIQFTILTTILDNKGDLSNTSCVTASNLSGESCVRGLPIQALPDTGETPIWRHPALWLGVMTLSVSVLLLGLGLLGYQSLDARNDF